MQNAERPRIFISYSWSGVEHEDRILSLAKRLVDQSIDVVIDKWSLQPGQNKYTFMEKMVNDKSIDKVLICSDRKYTEKANNRSGGVGTESTIISETVYKDHAQTKFIPVIFEKDQNGDPYLPTFISPLIYFDLCTDSPVEFEKLAMTIWEVPIFEKPALGPKPKFLQSKLGMVAPQAESKLTNEYSIAIKSDYIEKFPLLEISPPNGEKSDAIEAAVDASEVLRRDVFGYHKLVIDSDIATEEKVDCISQFFEDLTAFVHEPGKNGVASYNEGKCVARYLGRTLLLTEVAYVIKLKNFQLCGKILDMQFPVMNNSPYMGTYGEFNRPCGFIDGVLNDLKKQRKISYSIDRFLVEQRHEGLSVDDLIEADLVIFIHSVNSKKDWNWRPLCAIHSNKGYQIGRLFLILSDKNPSPQSLLMFGDSDYKNICRNILEYRKNTRHSLISDQLLHGPDILKMIGAVKS